MILRLDEIHAVVDALTASRVDRRDIVETINRDYLGLLPEYSARKNQFFSDVSKMSDLERLADGEIPLQIYLKNADFFASATPVPQKVIKFTLSLVNQRITGAPALDLKNIPEAKEVIIHQDDTLPFAFMEAGLKAAGSVMKVNVPAFENGQPKNIPNSLDQVVSNGTAWLLTDSLAITNHHVVNARKLEEPDASEQDLLLQGKSAHGLLDYDNEQLVPARIEAVKLEAWNKALDYAIIRFQPLNRPPLRFAAGRLEVKDDPVAVNIIQHPGGKSKRFGIRNNLASASTVTDLRYFTDTESGSSGSPVLNDRWEVVALHRGATYAPDATFQGKPTAYLNVGTHLSSIFDDLRQNYPALAGEINI